MTEDASGKGPPVEELDAIVQQVGRLSPGSVVRQIALQMMRGERVSRVYPLLQALKDAAPARWREREVAAWALGRADFEPQDRETAVNALLETLEQQIREPVHRLLARTAARSAAAAILLQMLLLYLFGTPLGAPGEAMLILWALLFLFTFPVMITAISMLESGRQDRIRSAAADSLGKLSDPESVGTLAGELFTGSAAVRAAAARALHRVLPTLTSEHYGALGPQSIANLGRALNHSDTQLVFKVLSALERVGTSHAIPFVEKLRRDGRTTRLRDAAENTLATLYARQKQEQMRDTLLRVASSPYSSQNTLLRPARFTMSDNPEQLLRPSSSPEEG